MPLTNSLPKPRNLRSAKRRLSTGDDPSIPTFQSTAAAAASGELKRARFSLGENRAGVHPLDETAEGPCRLCEQLCAKTILAQRKDIQALQKEIKQLKDSAQHQVQSLHTASVEAHRVLAEALKSWHVSVMALFNSSQPGAAPPPPPKFSGGQPPWMPDPASAPEHGQPATTDDTFDQGMFSINNGNLFDLGQLSPMVLNTDHFPS